MVWMTLWAVGLAQAAPIAADAAALCLDGAFTGPPTPAAFLTLLGATGAERTDPALVGAYEGCLKTRFELSERQARCYAIYSGSCENSLEWRTVDGSLRGEDDGGEATFTGLFQGTDGAGPAGSSEGVPWTWSPGADTSPPGPAAPDAPEAPPPEPAAAASGWAAAATGGPIDQPDPHGWWLDPDTQAAWLAITRASEVESGRAQREQARRRSLLAELLAPYGVNPGDYARREEAWACTQAAATRDLGGEGTLSAERTARLVGEARSVWADTAAASAEADAAGMVQSTRCLSHKLLILRAYNERASVLYDDAMAAIDACDPAALVDKQQQLEVAVSRSEQLGVEARSCLEPDVAGTVTTVVSVEGGLSSSDDDFADIDGTLDPVVDDLGANPVAAAPVSPFE